MKWSSKDRNHIRVYVLLGGFFLLFGLIIWRLFSIQIKQHDLYFALAVEQHQSFNSLIPYRGEIITQDGYALAINKKWPNIYAVPREIKDIDKASKILSSLLELDQETIKKRLNKPDDPYEPIKEKISEEIKHEIQELNLKGVKIGYNWGRYYPAENLASHVIGFISQGAGQYGLEKYFDQELSAGQDIVLTLDYTIQFFVEKKLRALVEQYQAKAGSIIIMDPRTGALTALTNYPNFNPNNYAVAQDISLFLNPAVHHVFEPGSVFKPITMATGLDTDKITPETTYFDTGERLIDGYSIHNWDFKSYGQQTMTQVLEKSLNTGAIFAVEQIGKKDFLQYVKNFGFGVVTGISLPGERKGDISNLAEKQDINYATASYGHGISVTSLQLITALAVIANNGQLMQPHIISQEAQKVGQVLSPQSAWQLSSMLKSVFSSGNLKNARVKGYEIAGKTGTAQIPEQGGYAQDKSIHTLVGYAPAFDAEFIILIKLDEPQGVRWSAVSLPPTFQEITKFLLNYYQIPPENK